MKKIQNKLIFFIGLCVVVFGVYFRLAQAQVGSLSTKDIYDYSLIGTAGIELKDITYEPIYDESGKKALRFSGKVKFVDNNRLEGVPVPFALTDRVYFMVFRGWTNAVTYTSRMVSEKNLFGSNANSFVFNRESDFSVITYEFEEMKDGFLEWYLADKLHIRTCLSEFDNRTLYGHFTDNCTVSVGIDYGETKVEFEKESLKLRKLDSRVLDVSLNVTYKNNKQTNRAMVPNVFSSKENGAYRIQYSICKARGDKKCLEDLDLVDMTKSYFNISYPIKLSIPEYLLDKEQDYIITFFQKDNERNSISKEFNYSKMVEVEANEIEFSNLKLATEDNDIVKLTGSLVWNNPQKEGQVLTNALNGITIKVLNHEGASMGEFGFSPVVVPGKYGEMLDFSRRISVKGIQEGRRITIIMQHENAQSVSITFEKKADGTFQEYKDPEVPVERPSDIGGNTRFVNPLKDGLDTIPKIVAAVINGIILPITIPFFAIALIWSGFLYIKARGNPGKINEAHTAIKWTLIGGAVILGAYVIGQAVQSTVVDIISLSQKWYG